MTTPILETLHREHRANIHAIEQEYRALAVALAVERREMLEAENVRFEMAVKGVRT